MGWIDGPPRIHLDEVSAIGFPFKGGALDWLGFCIKPDVLPFSRRPPPPEEYFLRSGDFQAVNAPPRQDAYGQAFPQPPRAPVFARQAASTPYGFSQNRQLQQYGDLGVPPPPHSLAPVAMGSHVTATGSQNRAQSTVTLREKPSLKWGVMIALTGALLGGVLGLGMDANRQKARAAAAADARDSAPLAVTTALPTGAANALAAVPAVAPIAPIAPTTLAGTAARPATILAPSAPVAVTVAPAKTAEPVAKTATAKPAPVRHTGFVAAKIPKPAPEKVEKAEAPAPAEKAAKVEKAEPAKTEKAEKAPSKGSSDARKVLEDAIKDTTNTL